MEFALTYRGSLAQIAHWLRSTRCAAHSIRSFGSCGEPLVNRLCFYLAISIARVSRSTVTLISPGKVISSLTRLAIACAIE